jgi:hypothetical protein
LPLTPARAYEFKVPSVQTCAAMYLLFSGPKHDDPSYLAMRKYAREHGAYTRAVQVNPGFWSHQPISAAEEFEEDKNRANAILKNPVYVEVNGDGTNTIQFAHEMYGCAFGYLIRPSASALDWLNDPEYFETSWRQAQENRRKQEEAERAQAQADANNGARNTAYGQANSALSRCMSMPSSVDMANPNYPGYTQLKWQCEDIRREAIKIAQSSGDNATAMDYINMRFPWQ